MSNPDGLGNSYPASDLIHKARPLPPESLGLPTLDTALVEVRTRRFTHPAVELASWERHTLRLGAYRPIFEQAYAQLLRQVVAGEDLGAEVLKGLPTREQSQHSPEYYQKTGQRGAKASRRCSGEEEIHRPGAGIGELY